MIKRFCSNFRGLVSKFSLKREKFQSNVIGTTVIVFGTKKFKLRDQNHCDDRDQKVHVVQRTTNPLKCFECVQAKTEKYEQTKLDFD